MPYQAIYTSKDEIPEKVENFRELFVEKNGKWELAGIAGVQTQANVDRLDASLKAERADHKKTRDTLASWGEFGTAEELRAKLDRIEELEAAASGKLDDAKVEELAQKRAEGMLRTRTLPLERELKAAQKAAAELAERVSTYEKGETRRTIRDTTRAALAAKKVLPEAHDDALLWAETIMEVTEDGRTVTREGIPGVTPGLDPAGWLEEIHDKRAHWWPPSEGGGANGSRRGPGAGKNPWSADHWNVTDQAKLYREDSEKASRMAQAAGSRIGATTPPPRKAVG